MATCGSLQHIFENPLPENPTLLESLSWNQIKTVNPIEQSSFTEIFGELHFKENTQSPSSSFFPISSSPSSSLLDLNPQTGTIKLNKNDGAIDYSNENKSSSPNSLSSPKNQFSICHKNSDSLQLCTEGLGFESSDDVEDLKSEINQDWQIHEQKVSVTKHTPSEKLCGELKKTRTSGGAFPPPISCIGKSGKPWVCFKSYRHDGRFVLKEVRIPTQEFLHACREDGRLKLHFVQPNDETLEQEDDEEKFQEQNDEEEENEETSDNDDDDDADFDDNEGDDVMTAETSKQEVGGNSE